MKKRIESDLDLPRKDLEMDAAISGGSGGGAGVLLVLGLFALLASLFFIAQATRLIDPDNPDTRGVPPHSAQCLRRRLADIVVVRATETLQDRSGRLSNAQ